MFTSIIILLNITHAEGIFLAFDSFFRLTLVTLNVLLHTQMLPTDQWLHLHSLLGVLETKYWFWFQI